LICWKISGNKMKGGKLIIEADRVAAAAAISIISWDQTD
jgi:hypothetical protein